MSVRVVCDDDTYDAVSYHDSFQAPESAGIPVVQDNRSSLMHDKFFVIDSAVVWTGSTNVTDAGFTYNQNNCVVITSTLLAETNDVEFDEMFVDRHFGRAKSDNTQHEFGRLECYFSPTDGVEQRLIEAIQGADSSIYFAIFTFTSDAVRDALVERADAGVKAEGMFDRLQAGSQYSQDEALCAAGVPAKIEDFSGKLHDKFMVIDPGSTDPTVITGSYNWTSSGANDNDENTLVNHDEGIAVACFDEWGRLWDAIDQSRGCNMSTPSSHLSYLPLLLELHNGVVAPTGTPKGRRRPARPSHQLARQQQRRLPQRRHLAPIPARL